MSVFSEEIKPVIEKLKTERDELKVQLNLARMELRDELESDWHELEHKWQNMLTKKVEFENSMEDRAASAKQEVDRIIDELKKGYKRMKDSIK